MASVILCENGNDHYSVAVFPTRFGSLCMRCIRNAAAESNTKFDAGLRLVRNDVPPFIETGHEANLAIREVEGMLGL